MEDVETGTLWSHVTGEALIGELSGKRLEMLPVVQTTWAEWKHGHPKTKALKKDQEVLSSRYESYFEDPDKVGLFRTEWLMERMPAKQKIHGATLELHAVAVSDSLLKVGDFVMGDLGDQKILAVRARDGGVRVFLANAGGTFLTFHRRIEDGRHVDLETESVWDIENGVCHAGKLAGAQLEQLPVTVAFWFAWSAFYPNTGVID